VSQGRRKDEREDCAAIRPGIHLGAAAMRFHDLRDDISATMANPSPARGRLIGAVGELCVARAVNASLLSYRLDEPELSTKGSSAVHLLHRPGLAGTRHAPCG
jgi:hypothetical protein